MKTALFINACVEADTSRTLRLCRAALRALEPQYTLCEIDLARSGLLPHDGDSLRRRSELCAQGRFDDASLAPARAVRDADLLLIGAPYWDLSFPASLKIFLERVSVCGVTFRYGENGAPQGLCKAGALLYVTTSGGFIGPANYGFDYAKALFGMFGVSKALFQSCEGLDILGADVEAKLRTAEQQLRQTAAAL